MLANIGTWQARKHGDMSFHFAQVLSGHGFFWEYLCIKGFTSSSDCQWCVGVPEDAEHVMFECPRFASVRQELLGEGGSDPVQPDNLQQHMLRDQATWSRICEAARQITVELQRSWDAERANRAAEDMAQREAELEEITAHRAEVVAARNNRRYARRREQRAREREECRGRTVPFPSTVTIYRFPT